MFQGLPFHAKRVPVPRGLHVGIIAFILCMSVGIYEIYSTYYCLTIYHSEGIYIGQTSGLGVIHSLRDLRFLGNANPVR